MVQIGRLKDAEHNYVSIISSSCEPDGSCELKLGSGELKLGSGELILGIFVHLTFSSQLKTCLQRKCSSSRQA